jgi:rfaE bifunctional protein kinase chain/domain
MIPRRFQELTEKYAGLRIAIFGDFCLDRYLEIDPSKAETSIETGLPVHNVVNVRAQPGGAGTILNNLSALGIGTIYPVGVAGNDGEGYELWRALQALPGVRLDFFHQTEQRRTFTYCKPLVMAPGQPPVELSRLDSKNWTPTPDSLQQLLAERLREVARLSDAVIVLEQVDLPETGVITRTTRAALGELSGGRPELLVIADSRRGLADFPAVVFKMNVSELSRLAGVEAGTHLEQIGNSAAALAARNRRQVFVTLAERGVLGAAPDGMVHHVPSLPLRGEIDIVGAGDAVTANLAAALSAGAAPAEALELANAAASVVIHKLGTTGTASVAEIAGLISERQSSFCP